LALAVLIAQALSGSGEMLAASPSMSFSVVVFSVDFALTAEGDVMKWNAPCILAAVGLRLFFPACGFSLETSTATLTAATDTGGGCDDGTEHGADLARMTHGPRPPTAKGLRL